MTQPLFTHDLIWQVLADQPIKLWCQRTSNNLLLITFPKPKLQCFLYILPLIVQNPKNRDSVVIPKCFSCFYHLNRSWSFNYAQSTEGQSILSVFQFCKFTTCIHHSAFCLVSLKETSSRIIDMDSVHSKDEISLKETCSLSWCFIFLLSKALENSKH